MKIICDCGREVQFIKEGNDPFYGVGDNAVHCSKSSYEISIEAEHDEAWFYCKCGEAIHIFT